MKLWLSETGFLSHIWVNFWISHLKNVSKACYTRCSSADELGTELSSHMCLCGGVLRPEHPTDHASNYRCFLVSQFGIKKSSSRRHWDNNTLKLFVNCTEIFQMWPVWLGRVRMGGSRQVWIFACTCMKSWWFISGAPEYVDFLKPVYSFFSSILHSICTFFYEKKMDSKYVRVKQRKKLKILGVWYFFGWHQPVLTVQGGGTGRCYEKSTVQGRRLHAPPASDWVGPVQLFYSLCFR